MEKRYRLALMLLAIVCIFNILTGFLLLFKNQKLESTRQVYSSNVFENSSVDNNEVLSAETSNSVLDERRVHNLDSLRFCYNDICKEVPFPVFDSWIIDGKLDRDVVQDYIDTEVRKYFQPFYDLKKVVKNRKGEFYSRVYDNVPDYSTLYDQLFSEFASGVRDITIVVPSMVYAGTDGEFAQKYIEVDSSQQKLYVWNTRSIEKVIDLSGPRYDSEVHGVFTVVDKGLEPIAPGDKYMPYWLAFYYEPSKEAWYGLHGLIWMYREDGTKWIEPTSNIGVRISGGCIRMVVEDAKYLYERFEKGDYILIHP